jgi:hypothetical protein
MSLLRSLLTVAALAAAGASLALYSWGAGGSRDLEDLA